MIYTYTHAYILCMCVCFFCTKRRRLSSGTAVYIHTYNHTHRGYNQTIDNTREWVSEWNWAILRNFFIFLSCMSHKKVPCHTCPQRFERQRNGDIHCIYIYREAPSPVPGFAVHHTAASCVSVGVVGRLIPISSSSQEKHKIQPGVS